MALSKENQTKIKDMLSNINDIKENLEVHVEAAATALEAELKVLKEFKELLDEKYEEMSEKVQEGDKGQELQSLMEAIDAAIEHADELHSDLEDNDPFDDLITSIEEMLN